ncbi:MAG TPA: DUF3604 domain-containing protein [Bryobacteraceae bacterium]|jgi:hypothetical protein
MRRLAILLLLALPLPAQNAIGVRILMGMNGKIGDKWDGSVTASGARITSVEPWRFDTGDAMGPNHSWKASIHSMRRFGGAQQQNAQQFPIANGVLVFLDSAGDSSTLNIKTAQGDFSVSLRDLPWGNFKAEMSGRVLIDRVPGYQQITNSPDEEDYPAAAAAKDGTVWIAYIDFKHSPDYVKVRLPLQTAPANFDRFSEKPGGDQCFARKFSNGAWGPPIAISEPGGDMWRPAIAIDGSGRPWVFWSANKSTTGLANYDLYARSVQNDTPGKTIQLTTEAGSDIMPAATTDSNGHVWVAWQAWRNGRAQIHAATQQGDAFGKTSVVASSNANEWDPAIAADGSGHVSVAWDSYRNGNYDVYVRTATGSNWGKEIPAAASLRYEAYPSIAYDPSGCLWFAYEEGSEGWGKDFGAYDTTGMALYQGRAVRLRGMQPDGKWVAAAAAPGAVITGVAAPRPDRTGTQNETDNWLKPDPENAKTRQQNQGARNVLAPKNTSPRLLSDSSGRLYLAYRSPHPTFWMPIGTIWSEYLVSYDGKAWNKPIFLPHSDNLLDNRPALVAAKPGELMIIGSSDHRRELPPGMQQPARYFNEDVGTDRYNNDLFAVTIALGAAHGNPPTASMPAPAVAAAPAWVAKERHDLMVMHSPRPDGFKVARGEFHRHSEVSMDGGTDGLLIDQFRYAIDTGALDWVGCCDHDNGNGREYTWWITQKLTDIFYNPGHFSPMFNYERSVAYPEGHRNVIFAQRGIRTLPRLPKMANDSQGHAPDTQMLYRYLKQYNGIVASHTSGTKSMGTDWRDNDPAVEPLVEIYQGDRQNYETPGAPRSNSNGDSIGGWQGNGWVSLAFEKGYQFSFEASSDHISTHISYGGVLVKEYTRQAILDAIKARHVYGATDNIMADMHVGNHVMGDAFTVTAPPEFKVKLVGTGNFAKVYVVKNNKYVYTLNPGKPQVEFTWRDNEAGKGTSYYYVRGEQEDGNLVWVSPVWITM